MTTACVSSVSWVIMLNSRVVREKRYSTTIPHLSARLRTLCVVTEEEGRNGENGGEDGVEIVGGELGVIALHERNHFLCVSLLSLFPTSGCFVASKQGVILGFCQERKRECRVGGDVVLRRRRVRAVRECSAERIQHVATEHWNGGWVWVPCEGLDHTFHVNHSWDGVRVEVGVPREHVAVVVVSVLGNLSRNQQSGGKKPIRMHTCKIDVVTPFTHGQDRFSDGSRTDLKMRKSAHQITSDSI